MRTGIFLLFIYVTIGCLSCKKERLASTIIYGRITDSKTGSIVPNAYLYCFGFAGPAENEQYQNFSTYSDINGNYTLSIPPEYRFTFQSAEKNPEYLIKLFPATNLISNDSNKIDIQLIPKDGYIKLIAKNISGFQDSVFIKLSSPTVLSEGFGLTHFKNYPEILQIGESVTEVLAFPSEENISIFWDFILFQNSSAQFEGSIFLVPKDTVSYTIEY